MNESSPQAAAGSAGLDIERQRTKAAGIVAMVLGIFLVYGAGLAQPEILHNAAHDARHSFAFPCH